MGAAVATAAAVVQDDNYDDLRESAPTTYVVGNVYPTLPGGCATPNVQGTTYYLCGNTWFQPNYGANGVYYKVVTAP